MAKKRGSAAWSMDSGDVGEFRVQSRSGGRRRASQSRAMDTSGITITLTHRPTGIEVAGEVPAGGYSRTELTELERELRAALWAELEERVARHLRIPGR